MLGCIQRIVCALDQAIERGDVATSTEINTFAMLGAFTLALLVAAPTIATNLLHGLKAYLANAHALPDDAAAMKLVEGLETKTEGSTCMVSWDAPADGVWAVLEKMAERWDVGFRVRDLAVAADGSLWLVEDAFPGGLYKLTKK